MCQADVAKATSIVLAEAVVASPSHLPGERFFAGATILLLALLALVGIGIGVQEPGAGILYGILVLPPVVGTVLRIQYRKGRGDRITWADRFGTLALSGAIMVGLVGLIAFVGFIALFIMCFAALR
jgi:hypothetical protein